MRYPALAVLSVLAGLAGALTAHAQSITTIYSFSDTDGANPIATLTLGPDGNFYGTTQNGGSSDDGTVFKVTTDGTLTTLADFNGTNGANSIAAVTLGPDGNFYGTTYSGGSTITNGTVFKMTTNGTLTTLVNFTGANGGAPETGLTVGPDGNFYGTTSGFGSGLGTVFKVTTSGTLTTLVNFNGTNGANPTGGNLTLGPDGNFYGTTYDGGNAGGYGTVFKVMTDGTLTTLVNFNSANGANPKGRLTLGPDGNFYGTTIQGGNTNLNSGFGYGTVFKVTTNGTLTTLVNFSGTNGADPEAGLTLGPDGIFYGTTGTGATFGALGVGTVFKLTTNGMLTTLVVFNGTNGGNPYAGLTLGPDGNFYGAAGYGGNEIPPFESLGTIYRLDLQPDFIATPTNQTVVIGGSATFNCQVFGTAPFSYQWLSNGVPIAGATKAALGLSPAVPSDMANYQLVVTNSYGSVTSHVASLNVLLQPNTYAISNSGGGNCTVYLGSQPNSTNRLWATTNLTRNQWQVIATNVTDSNGLAQFLDTNAAGLPQKFYRLSYT